MSVPHYHRTRRGRMFRVQRAAERQEDGGTRYLLRAHPVSADTGNGHTPTPIEVAQVNQVEDLRDRLRRGQHVPTPEQVFEQLWQQLRVELEAAQE